MMNPLMPFAAVIATAQSKCFQLVGSFMPIVVFLLGLLQVNALAATLPDLTVCDGLAACDAEFAVCKAGHSVALTGFTPANLADSGNATYTYEVCSPPLGTCSFVNGDSSKDCSDHDQCELKCNGNPLTCGNTEVGCDTDADCVGTCNRQCAVDEFHALNRFDVGFPLLADTSCLGGNNEVGGTCACDAGPESGCDVDEDIAIGDGNCFPNQCVGAGQGVATCGGTPKKCSGGPFDGQSCSNDNSCRPGMCALTNDYCLNNGQCGPTPVASCTAIDGVEAGDCIVMTLEIAGETAGLGSGPMVVVDREQDVCTSACMQGPSCDVCDEVPEGEQCLTRSLGFFGTHPWITNDYGPVVVCGKTLVCDGADDGESNPSCENGHCDDIMEGLGSIPSELKGTEPYVAMIKQLTAAKLNLNATDALLDASCSSFCWDPAARLQVDSEDGECPENTETIQEVIERCEGLCSANKPTISNSGCIEALDGFNTSQDVLDDSTPAPFDRPSVDDHGDVSGADSRYFTGAQKNKVVVGKKINGGMNCE